ncbi:MAG: U32 family peptidase [Planctomycetes bacterium]|nr:U32 family peptidase [Planctomycetota bacterium]
MAPAGDWESLRAAVSNGADAVYFGLSDFNARHRATNFTLEELPEVMRALHERNVRGYVAFNTLVFSDELPRAAEFLRAIARAGADAVIVQDLGLVRLLRLLAPSLPIHASTQMTLTEARGIELARQWGVERAILARELSIRELRKIMGETALPLEVFVHGALCVSYSGQCLTSESIGGRSANRGQCAQACRLPYELIVDGCSKDMGDRAYLLSPQDLAAYERVGELAELGLAGLKIEGRLKSAHYVAAATRTYRSAIESAQALRPFALDRQQQEDLALSFSRGLTRGFLDGVDHQRLVHGRFSKHRGVLAGLVAERTARGVTLAPPPDDDGRRGAATPGVAPTLKPGDGVVFDGGHPEQDEQGGRVFSVLPVTPARGPAPGTPASAASRLVEITFRLGEVNLAAVSVGDAVWKTDDPAVRRRLEQSYAREDTPRRSPLRARVCARLGQPLRIQMRGINGEEATVTWEVPLERARKHPLSVELVREHLGRLGATPFGLESVEVEALDPVMVPKSVLNDLRRQAVERLLEKRAAAAVRNVARPDALDALRAEIGERRALGGPAAPGAASGDALSVLVRNFEQLQAALEWSHPSIGRPALVYGDFEDVRRYREAAALARAAGIPSAPATLRIAKPGEEGLLRQVAECGPDAVLVRHLAGLSYFREHAPGLPLIGDYSLNVANEITADILADAGLVRLTPSFDLNWRQLAAMLGRIDPGLFEVVIHQHMPMFHMEHCVFAAFLSKGRDSRDCGRPCDRHRVEMRDRAGAANPVIADAGCRNTVFNAVAQSASEYVPRMKALGIRRFRVELLRQTREETRVLLDTYAAVIAGQEDGRRTWHQLRVLNQMGVTRGTLEQE